MAQECKYLYERSEYNAKGKLVKQYRDTGSRTTPTAPTLYEYDAFGNVTKQTLALTGTPTVANSPIVELTYGVESTDDGVFQVITQTRYNAAGDPLTSTQKQLISELDGELASKSISIDERGKQSVSRTEYYPSVVTDALGNTACYRYDIRGRKVSEWGTGIQPACFAYDDADRLTELTTFRATGEVINSDPRERTDGDTTRWTYHDATGLEWCKTYADGSNVSKTYDAFNRLATETDARGIVKTHTYDTARGLLLGTTYSDGTTARAYQYNHLGQLVQVTDDAGTRTLGYNSYGEQETDSLIANGVTHLITETRDSHGRSTGYTYAKNGAVQQTVTTGYGTDGRIATAGFLHGGAEKQFSYSYLEGSNLLQILAMPNNMTLTQSYEASRDLLTGMEYKRGSAVVTQRHYTYDALRRPHTRNTQYPGKSITHQDTFAHNSRSELTQAQVNGENYTYAYDNIGNRESAQQAAETATQYEANELNQYTTIGDFTPQFDAAGNQTRVKTSTGIWQVSYNAENRPVRFESEDGSTIVECTYDYMGRRATKKVTDNGSITQHQRYIYRGYLQIACCDHTRSTTPCLWLITWESPRWFGGGLDKLKGFAPQGRAADGAAASQPTQPIATRPLAIRKDGTWYAYGWDLTKNICEIYGSTGYIRTLYTYSPYGEVTVSGDVTQPIQWSSEFSDAELSLMYYNYRYYNPSSGKWLVRDSEKYGNNLYIYCNNNPIEFIDRYGLFIDREYPQYAVDFIAEIAESLKNYGREMGLSDNDIIATAMALAEEYSARENYCGIKRVIDELQDWICKNEFIFVFGNDFGKGNINQNTARSVDLAPLDKVNPPGLKEAIANLLKSNTKTRLLIECNEGTTILSLLIMIQTVKDVSLYTEKLPEEEKAQVNANAWREGPQIVDRMEENKQKNPSEYQPSSGMEEELVKKIMRRLKML